MGRQTTHMAANTDRLGRLVRSLTHAHQKRSVPNVGDKTRRARWSVDGTNSQRPSLMAMVPARRSVDNSMIGWTRSSQGPCSRELCRKIPKSAQSTPIPVFESLKLPSESTGKEVGQQAQLASLAVWNRHADAKARLENERLAFASAATADESMVAWERLLRARRDLEELTTNNAGSDTTAPSEHALQGSSSDCETICTEPSHAWSSGNSPPQLVEPRETCGRALEVQVHREMGEYVAEIDAPRCLTYWTRRTEKVKAARERQCELRPEHSTANKVGVLSMVNSSLGPSLGIGLQLVHQMFSSTSSTSIRN